MRIRDIVNKDIVNLTNCEQEPIHIPGSIQPHGFLLGLSKDLHIDFCSGNTEEFTGISYNLMLGKALEKIVGEDSAKAIRQHIVKGVLHAPLMLDINGRGFFCTIHPSNNVQILEAEPVATDQMEHFDVYDQTRQFLSYMQQSITLKQLCQLVAEKTQQITGYDRVMIYRFDEQYNGEVFAEAVREDLEPFLGLHYPHTDIPAQARELYLKNLLRLISDINYKPVPIYTIDNGQDQNLDLSLSVLRSVSPIHVQYLQNMGVGATLTISLIHQQRLWGLIACHHYSEKNLSPNHRLAAQLQGLFIASQIDMRQSIEEYEVARKTAEAVDKTLTITKSPNTLAEIVKTQQLMEVCNATGVCILFKGELFWNGLTPSEKNMRAIIKDLSVSYLQTGFDTAYLAATLPYASDFCDSAAGVIYHSLSMTNDDCIIWFRPETITEKHWGGDPNKAIIKNEKGLHPRKSFELWKEIVKCKATPWLQPELNAAANYAYILQKHMALLVTSANEGRYRKLNETLKKYNDELENINWISTHDLQEPLRKIQLMASRVLDNEDEQLPSGTRDLVLRMNSAANRMQILLRDILNYTRIRNSDEEFSNVDLNTLLQEVVYELDDQINENQVTIDISKLPIVKGIPFLLKQLFVNLLSNAVKFSDSSRPQHIRVNTMPDIEIDGKPYHHIAFQDTGIGFEQKYAQSIFKIFSRLNNQNEFEGSGVGLALCRQIMEIHNGTINAKGSLGDGAVFNLYFPLK